MFCPKCITEYNEGIKVCADCGTTLVDQLPPEPPNNAELVTVLTSGDLSVIALAKSILEEAEIPFVAKGEFPMEQLAVGPAEIQVDQENQTEARNLLKNLAEGKEAEGLIEQIPPDEDEPK